MKANNYFAVCASFGVLASLLGACSSGPDVGTERHDVGTLDAGPVPVPVPTPMPADAGLPSCDAGLPNFDVDGGPTSPPETCTLAQCPNLDVSFNTCDLGTTTVSGGLTGTTPVTTPAVQPMDAKAAAACVDSERKSSQTQTNICKVNACNAATGAKLTTPERLSCCLAANYLDYKFINCACYAYSFVVNVGCGTAAIANFAKGIAACTAGSNSPYVQPF